MKTVLFLTLVGADLRKHKMVVTGIKTVVTGNGVLINGKTIREIVDESGYNDFKIDNWELKDLIVKSI